MLRSLAGSLIDRTARMPVAFDAILVVVLSVATAVIVFGLWQHGLHSPLVDFGDSTYYQFLIKTIVEHGWYTHNPDVGAPFGATMYDFPIPEPTHLLLIRLLGLISKDPVFLYNLFYLVSFGTTGLAAWWALRNCGVNRPLAIAGAFLFAILPYHFLRLGHLLLAAYFAVPIFGAYAVRLALFRGLHPALGIRVTLGSLVLIAIAAGAGIYYAFFGCLFLVAGAVMGSIRSQNRTPLLVGAACVAIIVAVIALSLVPNALYHQAEGANLVVAQRMPDEAEILGLRLTQLLLPSLHHRLSWLASLTGDYYAHAPFVNESWMSTLGLLGSVGLIAAMWVGLFGPRERFATLAAIGTLAIIGILFATIGGFGALFAFLVTPEMRGLNRISVCIAFFALLALVLLVQHICDRKPWVCVPVAILLMILGTIDEIPTNLDTPTDAAFQRDQPFYDKLQSTLTPGTEVYELPYIYFPESPKAGSLFSYAHFEPYLRTSGLRFSFGDMHGRASDAWNEQVSHLEGSAFINALAGAGFGAIYLNRAGYSDKGASVEHSLTSVLGPPLIDSSEHTLAVWRIPLEKAQATRPFIVAQPARGWYPQTENAKGVFEDWSKGSAELLVVNPGAASSFEIRFTAISPMPRNLEFHYGDTALGRYDLKAGVPQDVDLHFRADPGITRLRLETDRPAQRIVGEKHPVAFRIIDLAYGASAP